MGKITFTVEIDTDAWNRAYKSSQDHTDGNVSVPEMIQWKLEELFGEGNVEV